MNLSKNGLQKEDGPISSEINSRESAKEPKKGPLSFFTGSITSISFCFLSFIISKNLIIYFAEHTPNFSSPIAQSISSGFKTLIIGVSFLATFTFAFIGLGLFLVFLRSLFEENKTKID